MRIAEDRIEDVTVLSITGEFDARTAPQAHARLDGILQHLRTRLVFNLSSMEVVTSTAISFLIDAAKRTRKLGGDAVLSQPPRLLMSSLKSLDIGEYFKTFDSDPEALEYFRDLVPESSTEADTGAEQGTPASEEATDPDKRWWRFGR